MVAKSKKASPVWRWFISFTTIGGLTHYGNSNRLISKVSWVFLFLAGVGLTVVSVVNVVDDYLKYEVATTVTTSDESNVYFPAVTFCNMNRIHCGNLAQLILDCEIDWKCQNSTRRENLCLVFFAGNCRGSIRVTMMFRHGRGYNNETLNGICRDVNYTSGEFNHSGLALIAAQDDRFTALYSNLSKQDMVDAGHKAQDLFSTCTFEGAINTDPDCVKFLEGSTQTFHPKHGNCYSFNYQASGSIARRTALSGSFFGLTLWVNLETDFSMKVGRTQNDGMMVILHEANKAPVMASSSIQLKPNSDTNIAIKIARLKRKTHPYPGINSTQIMYQSKLCHSYCLSQIIRYTCNCTLASLYSVLEQRETGSSFCKVYGSDRECITMATQMVNREGAIAAACSCPPECEETEYNTGVSASTWPGTQFWSEIALFSGVTYHGEQIRPGYLFRIESSENRTEEEKEMLAEVKDFARRNFLKVNVFLESKRVTTIQEYPKVSGTDLLSNLGGAFSLYLGVSIIALFEVMELGFRLIKLGVQSIL